MCGIICIVSSQNSSTNLLEIFENFKQNLLRRGPDSLNFEKYRSENYDILFAATVLWLQGKCITVQPLYDDNSVFIYNGDVFGGISDDSRREFGDTKIIFELLRDTKSIPKTLSKLHGPYAFVYFDKQNQKLYFGRDVYGRRSLLIGKNGDALVITSVAKRTSEYDFIELPSIGTFCLDLETDKMFVVPLEYQNQNFASKLAEVKSFLNRDIFIMDELGSKGQITFLEPNIEQLYLLSQIKDVQIDAAFEIMLNNRDWLARVLELKEKLEEALRKRISSQPNYCNVCIKERKPCRHSSLGVLFSGGVDCAVLAVLVDEFVEKNRPIDLINVAFDELNGYLTPDRITGLKTLEELKNINPSRKWNFIEVNVSQTELDELRKERIADLIYPLKSILDDSLGCALWFASRGKQGEDLVSSCRGLLVGMGADELFGGYTRHRAAFKKHSWLGLHNVLNEDWQNISHRNLGRDDRVVSDHGRQLRTPYLDEDVVNFVRSLNSWEKTFPSDQVPQGFGEKILLRSLAYYIGLKSAASFKKRALQFGSRIANKKENAHDVSSRLCSR